MTNQVLAKIVVKELLVQINGTTETHNACSLRNVRKALALQGYELVLE